MNGWLKTNALQIFTIVIGALLVAGQWQARNDSTIANAIVNVEKNSARLSRLEDLASQERARLDGVYLRRDLSDEQLRAIAQKLEVIDKRIERIEVRTR